MQEYFNNFILNQKTIFRRLNLFIHILSLILQNQNLLILIYITLYIEINILSS